MGESSRMRLCIATAEAQALLRAWFLSLRALLVKTNPGLAQANTGSVEAASQLAAAASLVTSRQCNCARVSFVAASAECQAPPERSQLKASKCHEQTSKAVQWPTTESCHCPAAGLWASSSRRRASAHGQPGAVARVEEPLGQHERGTLLLRALILLLADEIPLLAVVVESLQHRRRIDGQRQRPKARQEIDRLVRVGVLRPRTVVQIDPR